MRKPEPPRNRVLREGDMPCDICGSGPADHEHRGLLDAPRDHAYTRQSPAVPAGLIVCSIMLLLVVLGSNWYDISRRRELEEAAARLAPMPRPRLTWDQRAASLEDAKAMLFELFIRRSPGAMEERRRLENVRCDHTDVRDIRIGVYACSIEIPDEARCGVELAIAADGARSIAFEVCNGKIEIEPARTIGTGRELLEAWSGVEQRGRNPARAGALATFARSRGSLTRFNEAGARRERKSTRAPTAAQHPA